MRMNLPVTNVEVPLQDSTLIVSKTNLKGQITYINRDFLEISGFTEAELIGQPHNIVRHPDMPAEAFEDLYRTLKAGRPWIGMVKNRCKNGDYYWVYAHATPLVENGQTVGYMSVRKKPTRTQIEQAEHAYRLFREKKQGNLKIHLGQAVAETPFSKLNVLRDMSFKGRFSAIIALLASLLLLVGALGLYGMNQSNAGLANIYAQRMSALDQLAEIHQDLNHNRVLLDEILRDPKPELFEKTAHEIEQNLDNSNKRLSVLSTLPASPAEKTLIDKFSHERQKLINEGLKASIAALKAGKLDEAKVAANTLSPIAMSLRTTHKQFSQIHMSEAQAAVDAAQAQHDFNRNLMLALVIAGIAIASVLALTLIRTLVTSLQQAIGVFQQIAMNNYGNEIDITLNDEIGKLMQELEIMQTKLGFDLSEAKRIADENLRIKIALDNVSTGVMIANPDRHIIYANRSVVKILKGAEADIRKQLPNFNAEQMIGVNIDTFHKNPTHQANLLKTLSNTHTADFEIGGRYLRVSASPVIDAKGARLGTVAEWLDRTGEVTVEQEVTNMVQGAMRGDFEQRLSLEGKEGFFKQMTEGLNRLSEVTSNGLQDVARVLTAVAQGDLTKKVEAEYEGVFGQLKDDTNTTVERLKEVIGRIKEATEAINIASQEIAAGNSDLSSRTEEQASSLEETSSSMEELNATVKNNAENARQANVLAKDANEVATRGGEMVKRVVSTMSDIQGSSKKIADIIGVIDSIAFQTNILALNAAVEAARAGEQGRGFAVVATEVRNLAQRSATAAKEIKTLIAESVDKVESGAQLVDQAGKTMDEVVTSFQGVATLVTDISNASREQSGGIEQITQAVGQMDEVTQQNAALVEEAAAAAESLEEQARGLMQAVSMFKLDHTTRSSFQLKTPEVKSRLTSRQTEPHAPKSRPRSLPAAHASVTEDEWEEF